MSFSVTVQTPGTLDAALNDVGTFDCTVAQTAGTFTAALSALPGPKGDTGNTGATGPAGPAGGSGVAYATAPIAYDSGTQTVSLDSSSNQWSSALATSFGLPTYYSPGVLPVNSAGTNTIFGRDSLYAKWFTGSEVADIIGLGTAAYSDTGDFYSSSNPSGYITSSALSPYLTSSTAASTYQTISGMSSYLTTSSASSTYLTQANAATTYAPIAAAVPTGGTTGQVLAKSSGTNYALTWSTPTVGDRYYTTSTTSLAISNGSKSLTVGTGLSYTTQQAVIIAYDSSNHMHGVVTSYNSGTGAMVVDVQQKTGSGTYASWTVNVGGLSSVAEWGLITGTLSSQTDLQSALDAKLAVTTAASTYAPLASPTFTGDPKAPTPATSDNDTSIATTAFVNAYAPAASTSTAGKVQLATAAQSMAGTSTTLVTTPDGLVQSRMSATIVRFMGNDFQSTATSGTGGLNDNVNGIGRRVSAPTSTGTGYVLTYTSLPYGRGQLNTSNLDWSKRVVYSARINRSVISPSSNSAFAITIGEATVTTRDPAVAAIGIRVIGSGAMELLAHNGTTLTTVTTSHTPSNNSAFDLQLVSDGAGNVTAYVNGSSVGTTASGPSSGTGTSSQRNIYLKAMNDSGFTSGATQYLVNASTIQIAD